MCSDLWEAGMVLEFESKKPCHRAIISTLSKDEASITDIRNGNQFKILIEHLSESYLSGGIKLLAETRNLGDLSFYDLTEKEQLEANRKYKYIKALIDIGVNKVTLQSSHSIIEEIARKLHEKPPHWQSVRNWMLQYRESGNRLRGLYPKHRLKGNKKSKINKTIIEIINNESNRYYSQSQPTMASIYRNIEEKIIIHNLENPTRTLKTPSYNTISSHVLKRTHQEKTTRRTGKDSFRNELTNASSEIQTYSILDRVEIDHTQLDIHVVDDTRRTLLGRPFLTVLIDHYSHMVLGMQLSFESPSFASVCMACLNAFLPKDNYLKNVGCDSQWPAHGIPRTLVTDNGNEFWGKNFIKISEEVGSLFQYCPIRKANYKSTVERFFGLINSFVLDDLPGVVRKKGKEVSLMMGEKMQPSLSMR